MLLSIKKTGLALLALLSSSAFAGYGVLSKTRNEIKLPKYTIAQKALVLDQVKLILQEVFVHRDLKIKDFGPSSDPLPKIDALQKRLLSISDLDFHKSVVDIFYGTRDLHTLYTLPEPYSCYESFLPFRMEKVLSENRNFTYVISAIDKRSEILKLSREQQKLSIGDLVVSFNGRPVLQAIKDQTPYTFGANEEAQHRIAMNDIRRKDHSLDFLPEKNFVDVELQNSKGTKYKISIPWITYADDDCGKEELLMPSKNKRMASASGDTEEPILYWQINERDHGTFGYISLESFNPEKLTVDQVVLKIRDLLLNEMKETEGLIIDVRDNQGGQIPLSEKIIQLFTPSEITPLNFIMKSTDANYIYFKNSDPADPFFRMLQQARELGLLFTNPLPIDSPEEINGLGQVYFRPVAVFINSLCYSSCDMFAAQAQDHGSATIFGEDKNSGGGGANAYNLNEVLAESWAEGNPGPFKKLPHKQNIKFAFRQTIRVGKNAGKLIENKGVTADRLALMKKSDLFNSRNDQILILEKYLYERGPDYESSIYFDHENRHDFKIGVRPELKANYKGTDHLQFKERSSVFEEREVTSNSQESILLPINTSIITNGRIQISGSLQEKPVWRKILNYRVIPENLSLNAPTDLLKHFSFFAVTLSSKDGWQKIGDSLIIGNGESYQNLLETEASIFINPSSDLSTLHFSASVDSEIDFDFFKVQIVDNGRITELSKLSGHIPMNDYSFDISAYAGKDIEIRFVFKTDEGTKDKGVTIKNITIQ